MHGGRRLAPLTRAQVGHYALAVKELFAAALPAPVLDLLGRRRPGRCTELRPA